MFECMNTLTTASRWRRSVNPACFFFMSNSGPWSKQILQFQRGPLQGYSAVSEACDPMFLPIRTGSLRLSEACYPMFLRAWTRHPLSRTCSCASLFFGKAGKCCKEAVNLFGCILKSSILHKPLLRLRSCACMAIIACEAS